MSCEEVTLLIRPIIEQDLHKLWELNYKEKYPEWKKWDAPYFEHKQIPLEEYLSNKNSIVAWHVSQRESVCVMAR